GPSIPVSRAQAAAQPSPANRSSNLQQPRCEPRACVHQFPSESSRSRDPLRSKLLPVRRRTSVPTARMLRVVQLPRPARHNPSPKIAVAVSLRRPTGSLAAPVAGKHLWCSPELEKRAHCLHQQREEEALSRSKSSHLLRRPVQSILPYQLTLDDSSGSAFPRSDTTQTNLQAGMRCPKHFREFPAPALPGKAGAPFAGAESTPRGRAPNAALGPIPDAESPASPTCFSER